MTPPTNVNWKKWRFLRLIENIKCILGIHDLVDEENIEIGDNRGCWRKARYCIICGRGGDRL